MGYFERFNISNQKWQLEDEHKGDDNIGYQA